MAVSPFLTFLAHPHGLLLTGPPAQQSGLLLGQARALHGGSRGLQCGEGMPALPLWM